MKWLFLSLTLFSLNAFAVDVPEEVIRYFDGVTQPNCGTAKLDEEDFGAQRLQFVYGVKGSMNSYHEYNFKTMNAFGEKFTTKFEITTKDNFEILKLSLFELAEGGTWYPGKPGIIWGVTKNSFTVIKDASTQKIVSIEKHEYIRRKNLFGKLKKTWVEENSSPSCSDI